MRLQEKMHLCSGSRGSGLRPTLSADRWRLSAIAELVDVAGTKRPTLVFHAVCSLSKQIDNSSSTGTISVALWHT